MEKLCLSCQEKIFGRSDKKYCGDACRNSYHNSINQQNISLLRKTNSRLKKNYRILNEIPLKEGKGKISKALLLNRGFVFELFTSIYYTQKGTQYYFVYDLGYLKVSDQLFVVVKKY
ncbi:MAG: hypothetical protein ACI9KR_000949 [Arcticibacterium sp.]|jgi:hypothetical protein|tara:strand:+ start:957 stop:1307 length:351 start_codon:yes stop_codon:yes gene_type:complete